MKKLIVGLAIVIFVTGSGLAQNGECYYPFVGWHHRCHREFHPIANLIRAVTTPVVVYPAAGYPTMSYSYYSSYNYMAPSYYTPSYYTQPMYAPPMYNPYAAPIIAQPIFTSPMYRPVVQPVYAVPHLLNQAVFRGGLHAHRFR